jgi:hypothetical protein
LLKATGKSTVTDDDFVEAIVDELDRGILVDPRPLAQRSGLLTEHVRAEVRRSINRVRMLRTAKFKVHGQALKVPSQAQLDRAARALRDVAITAADWATLKAIRGRRRYPPRRCDPFKFHCAAEALFLVEMFSRMKPTGTVKAPFRTIADLIFEAVKGESPADDTTMKRACALVLRDRNI